MDFWIKIRFAKIFKNLNSNQNPVIPALEATTGH